MYKRAGRDGVGSGTGSVPHHDLGRLAMTGGSDPDCVSESVDLVVCVVICESGVSRLRLSDCLLMFVERLKAIFFLHVLI